MNESNPNFEKHTNDPALKKAVKASDLTQCLVPGFEKCKLEEVLEFIGLEKEYGTSELFEDGNKVPCRDTDGAPSYLAELNKKGFPHPDALLYDSLPENLFRALKMLGKSMGDRDKQLKFIDKWLTRVMTEEALPVLGTAQGIDFIIRLANDRQTKIEDWKAEGTGRESTKYQRMTPTSDIPRKPTRGRQSVNVTAGDGSAPRNDTATLSPVLLRKLLIDEGWDTICGRIAFYKEELDKLKIKLKEEGKKCEGCALNPYRAKFSKKLHEDFKDEKIISNDEIKAIKSKLKVDYLHVGMVEGKVYVR